MLLSKQEPMSGVYLAEYTGELFVFVWIVRMKNKISLPKYICNFQSGFTTYQLLVLSRTANGTFCIVVHSWVISTRDMSMEMLFKTSHDKA